MHIPCIQSERTVSTRFEWDPEKAATNFKKHAVRFAETEAVFHDDNAITIPDDESDGTEKRFVTIGMGLKSALLVVVYCYRGGKSAHHLCPTCCTARAQGLPGIQMKKSYSFARGKRGRVVAADPEPRVKTRITIRLDEDVLDFFLKQADASGGTVGYQTLINEALRQHAENRAPKLEDTLRQILREELRAAS